MKGKIFISLLAIFVLLAGFEGQVVHAQVGPVHPRLYFDHQDIVRFKALRNEPSHQAIWNNIKSWADSHTNDACLDEPSSYGEYWKRAEDIRYYIETMAFMYAMTDEATYAEAAKEWMFYVVNKWDKWDRYENKGHAITKMIRAFSSGYDMLHDYLTSAERDTLRGIITSKTNLVYDYYYGQDFASFNNANGLANAAGPLGLAGLALSGEHPDASKWLTLAIGMSQAALNYGGVDGGWYEGLNYGSFTFELLIPFFDALKRNTGQNLFDNQFLKELPYSYIYLNGGGKSLPMEDTEWGSWYYHPHPLDFLRRLASEYNNGHAQWFADKYNKNNNMQAFIWKDPNLAATSPTSLPLVRHFRGIGYVVDRQGWGDNDLIFVFKSGSSRGHAHPSQNEFNIYYKGKPVVFGPGYVTATTADDTFSHSCILVNGNGQCQEPGDYKSCELGTRGQILALDEFEGNYTHILGDASAVYTGWSGTAAEGRTYTVGKLDLWLRHAVFIKNPNYFVIFDRVEAPEDNIYDNVLNVPYIESTREISISDDVVTLDQRGTKVKAVIVEPEEFAHEIRSYPQYSENRIAEQIRISTLASAPTAEFLTVLYPDAVLPVEEVKVGNLIGLVVSHDDNKDLILFSSDGNPVDGYIELGDYFKAIDGGNYLFESTGVRVQFDGYQVLRLRKPSNVTLFIIIVLFILGALGTLGYVIATHLRQKRHSLSSTFWGRKVKQQTTPGSERYGMRLR